MIRTHGKRRAASCLLLLAFILSFGALGAYAAASPVTAASAAPEPLGIVTLGDSITAGYEPGMTLNSQPYGYSERLLEQAWFHGQRATLGNYGILGLTTAGLRNYTAALKDGTAISASAVQPGISDPRMDEFAAKAAQTKADLAGAKLIAITIGGNDVSSLLLDAKNLTDAELQSRVQQMLASYTTNVTAALENIRAINPTATIMLADQYQPVPSLYAGASYNKLMSAAASFTQTTDALAQQVTRNDAPVLVAHVAARFAGQESSLTHIISHTDFHPTQLGYEMIAKVFTEMLWGDYRVPSTFLTATASPRPMTIVVNGAELNTPNKPVNKGGQNFLPLADIVKAMGAAGTWDNKTSSATIVYGGRTAVITIGSNTMTVNGQKVQVANPAFLQKNGKEVKTYLPLAALASGLGFDVQYSAQLRTAFINP
ncbi:copper amine oxidase [Paenibacillus sp. HN-1]|uniref:stalk domain-containing protein n=1 Tax=Paenibacillus TaxID=44249 RepID=UPI001CA9A5F4|nr:MULTISPECIES: stalk domain-containing protein [Paenibacillus]MBY9079835.1 copper amine oxidase [Paenibacillus sp. CGMCC 1.18879]MBY9084476.1 copper amine oxidase [Paenibacillus sinensis]